MIDFRYHLVSIIAIFLALAVGIVVGTTALNGPVLDGLRRANAGLIDDKQGLQQDVEQLQTEVGTADGFATELAPGLVGGRLAGRRVLLVTTERTPAELADQVTPLLTQAGAQVSGRLRVQPDLLDEEKRQLVEDLVAQVVPAGVQVPSGEPVERAAAVLASALLARPGGEPVAREDAQAVVSAFEEADLVDLSDEGSQVQPAGLVLVLAGPPPAPVDPDLDERNEALLRVVEAMDAGSSGAVVAGPDLALSPGGLVRAVRESGELDADVSTVDNADQVIGRIAAVLALQEQGTGRAGRYGGGPGVRGPLPDRAGG